jgi:hypothetical protein
LDDLDKVAEVVDNLFSLVIKSQTIQ